VKDEGGVAGKGRVVMALTKQTKLSTILMVKTGSNVMVKHLFFMVKILIFVVKTDFLMFRPTNYFTYVGPLFCTLGCNMKHL